MNTTTTAAVAAGLVGFNIATFTNFSGLGTIGFTIGCAFAAVAAMTGRSAR